jgi:hypothetical protein
MLEALGNLEGLISRIAAKMSQAWQHAGASRP